MAVVLHETLGENDVMSNYLKTMTNAYVEDITLPKTKIDHEQHKHNTEQGLKAILVTRARIILLASEGLKNIEIAEKVNLTRETVGKWRRRFSTNGILLLVIKDCTMKSGQADRDLSPTRKSLI